MKEKAKKELKEKLKQELDKEKRDNNRTALQKGWWKDDYIPAAIFRYPSDIVAEVLEENPQYYEEWPPLEEL